jgi:hypothetical protein
MTKKIQLLFALLIISGAAMAQKIDLNNWSLTLPLANHKGKPMMFEAPELLAYETIEVMRPYFYRDLSDSSIVFYAFPSGTTTANSSYSRTELREQMESGNNNKNWTFADGAKMRGTLSVPEISQSDDGEYHKTIIMQIHGRLTNDQRDLIGQKDNNAPPMLKIYWIDGKVRVKTKVLKDLNANEEEILHEDAWGDDKGRTFKETVGTKKFTLEVNISEGKMTVTLNDKETFVYEDIHMQKWGVFENYFKAGNYFQSHDQGAYAKVKYYMLEVSH